MAESGPYWMRIREADRTQVDCRDGEVHAALEVCTCPRRGFLRVVTTVQKPDVVPDGMRVVRHFRVSGDVMEREYALERIG